MRLNFYFIVFFSTLLMGSSFPVGGLLVASGALPFSLVAQRFLIASLVGLLVVYFLACSSKESMKLPNLGAAFVVGIFQTSGVMASVFWGLQYAPPPLIAAILFSNVLLVAAAEVMMGGRSLTTTLALSLLLGAVGLAFATGAVVFLTEAPVRGVFYGEFAALGGAVCWAFATLLTKKVRPVDPWNFSCLQMLFGALVLVPVALLAEPFFWVPGSVSELAWLLWLAVPAGVLSFGLWFMALRLRSATECSAWLAAVPTFALLLEWILNGKMPQGFQWFGGALVVLGIALQVRERPITRALSRGI